MRFVARYVLNMADILEGRYALFGHVRRVAKGPGTTDMWSADLVCR